MGFQIPSCGFLSEPPALRIKFKNGYLSTLSHVHAVVAVLVVGFVLFFYCCCCCHNVLLVAMICVLLIFGAVVEMLLRCRCNVVCFSSCSDNCYCFD